MPNNQNSLRQVFSGGEVDAFKQRLAEVLTSDEYSELREEVGSRLRAMPWAGAVNKIVEQADALLDTPVSQGLLAVYAKANVLNRYLNREEYDPEEVVLAELAQHTLTSTHEPHLDVVINGQSVARLKLDVELKLALKGLILKIQDARIKEITPGTCRGSGRISFYGKVLLQKESEEVSLGTFDLGEGVPIAP